MPNHDLPTIRVRGGGGVEFDLDVHPVGTRRRELLDYDLSKRNLIVLEGAEHLEPEPEPEPETEVDESSVPVGSVADVLAWVRGHDDDAPAADGWEDRAEQALAAERATEKPRTTLIEALEAALVDGEADDG